jgi:hypothetical protein
MDRFVRSVRNTTLVSMSAVAMVGGVAGSVRLLPWLLDPAVPWQVAAPFARGLAAVALEAALLLGWPVGCALACFRLVETGEARVLQTLGESPRATIRRLAPQAMVLAVALGGVALVYGSDANAPGLVATELVSRARAACESAALPKTYAIPFTDMTWLCAPDVEPRLVGTPPGAMASAVITARNARIAGDFRALELDDARLLLPGLSPITVHVTTLAMHGMAPWARASTLPASLRAVLLAFTAWLASWSAGYAVLRRAARTRLGALSLGAVGPLASLAVLRLLERANASAATFVLVPVACLLTALLGAAGRSWRNWRGLPAYRLRHKGRAASTKIKGF